MCPGSHSHQVTELGFQPRWPDTEQVLLFRPGSLATGWDSSGKVGDGNHQPLGQQTVANLL